MDEISRYERSRKRADELGEFYQHLMIFVIINIILFAINMLTSPGYLWFIWPLAGWGLGISIHAVTVFGGSRFWGTEWRERKASELMKKDQNKGSE